MVLRSFIAAWFIVGFTFSAIAEEFLGEATPNSESVEPEEDSSPSQSFSLPSSNLNMSHQLHIAGSLHSFNARARSLIHHNSWLSYGLGGIYQDARKGSGILTLTGIDILTASHFKNPTMVTPFLEIGTGERWWKETRDDLTQSLNGGLVFGSMGAHVELSKFVVFRLERKRENYFFKRPFNPLDENQTESKTVDSFVYGFTLVI